MYSPERACKANSPHWFYGCNSGAHAAGTRNDATPWKMELVGASSSKHDLAQDRFGRKYRVYQEKRNGGA